MTIKNIPKLCVFIGAGGVGKTTLSAAYAAALANQGYSVGLISIDPAKRLHNAFQVTSLEDKGTEIPIPNSKGKLIASIIHLEVSLKRWVHELNLNEDQKIKLFNNPYFIALSEKIATSIDTLAGIRIAEWMEMYPDTQYLIIDTAPGLHAIDFISKPEKVLHFLDSKMVDWLKWFVEENKLSKQPVMTRFIKLGAKKILDGLSVIGGKGFLLQFGEFLISIDTLILRSIERLKYSHKLIFSQSCHFFLVSSVRNDSLDIAIYIEQELKNMELNIQNFILNKCISETFWSEDNVQELLIEDHSKPTDFKNYFSNFIVNYYHQQNKIKKNWSSRSNVRKVPFFSFMEESKQFQILNLIEIGNFLIHKENEK